MSAKIQCPICTNTENLSLDSVRSEAGYSHQFKCPKCETTILLPVKYSKFEFRRRLAYKVPEQGKEYEDSYRN